MFRDYLRIDIPKSKTDQHRDGHVVYISRLPSQYCPVLYVEKFLAEARLDLNTDGESYLIPHIVSTKNGHKAVKGSGISYTRVRELFKEALKPCVSNTKKYGLHSLRSGRASAAAENGVTDRMISKHGRWASEKGRNTYIKDSVKRRLKVSQSLGI